MTDDAAPSPAPRQVPPARLRWAVDRLALRGDEHVLEVGGGPGVSAALICARLTTGHLLAVDRSATAARATAGRNAAHVDAGRLTVRCSALADLDAPGAPDADVDVVLAVDVNVFWTGAAGAELSVLHRVLRPGGRLHLLWGAGAPTPRERILPRVRSAVEAAGFVEVTVVDDGPGFGVTARRP